MDDTIQRSRNRSRKLYTFRVGDEELRAIRILQSLDYNISAIIRKHLKEFASTVLQEERI